MKSWKVGVFPTEIRWFPLKFNCGILGQSKSKQSPIGAEVCGKEVERKRLVE